MRPVASSGQEHRRGNDTWTHTYRLQLYPRTYTHTHQRSMHTQTHPSDVMQHKKSTRMQPVLPTRKLTTPLNDPVQPRPQTHTPLTLLHFLYPRQH